LIALRRFWAVPAVVLKKLVMGTFETMNMDGSMVAAADFMVQKVSSKYYVLANYFLIIYYQ